MAAEQSSFMIRVECYAGYRGEETPRRFYLKDRCIEVIEIVDRWIAPDHRYYKICGNDDGFYIIRYEIKTKGWELVLFDRAEDHGGTC